MHKNVLLFNLSDASHSNACVAANVICDCCKQSSHHLIADAGTLTAVTSTSATESASAFANNDLDANDLTINATDIDSSDAFNTPSPIIRRCCKKVTCLLDNNDSSTALVPIPVRTRIQTHSKLAAAAATTHHRKSLSESDLLNEIDNALVFAKGFLYSYGK